MTQSYCITFTHYYFMQLNNCSQDPRQLGLCAGRRMKTLSAVTYIWEHVTMDLQCYNVTLLQGSGFVRPDDEHMHTLSGK